MYIHVHVASNMFFLELCLCSLKNCGAYIISYNLHIVLYSLPYSYIEKQRLFMFLSKFTFKVFEKEVVIRI